MPEEHVSTLRDKSAAALLELILTHTWEACTLSAIAEKANISETLLRSEFDKTTDIIPAIVTLIDNKIKDHQLVLDKNGSLADNLFEIFMTRFEIMQIHRNAIIKLANISRQSPACALSFYKAHQVMIKKTWSLIQNKSPKIACDTVKTHALLLIYHYSFLSWERDQTVDLSTTMTALDQAIKKASKLNLFATP